MVEQAQKKRLWLPRVQMPPQWGIQPVPNAARTLRFVDVFVLWSSLGIGLLVLEAGALLVPGLGLGHALLAIGIGTLAGNLLLALTGVAGSDHAIPTMVLLRSTLGRQGSYLPSVLNLVQLIGWTAFEFWVIALAANRVSQAVFGFSNQTFWLVIFAIWCVLLALGGPLVVVRQWLEKFGVWLVYGVTAWITGYLLIHYDVLNLLRGRGTGEMPFWLAVDLVIAMPISWMPLVADYTRFARRSRPAFWGTYLGYLLANVWFYGLGALLILTITVAELTPEHLIAAIMAMTGGAVALLVILVDETDNAFADIYSAAVTVQNIFPRMSQRLLVVMIGVIGLALAAFLTMSHYFGFLLLIGSVFVPLFGVFAADYFVLRKRRLTVDKLYQPPPSEAVSRECWRRALREVNWWAIIAWAIGVAVYHVVARALPWLGASLPGFLAAFFIYWALAQLPRSWGVRPLNRS